MGHPEIERLNERIAKLSDTKFPLNNRTLKLLRDQLEDFISWESINPYLTKEIKIAKTLLKDINLSEDYSSQINKIVNGLNKWKKIMSKKTKIIKPGNKHLRNLPHHKKYPAYFYVYVKELNFAQNIEVRHPINDPQLSIHRKRETKDLLKIDRKDPITGHRFFLPEDSTRYPGSGIFITTGHHRLYELYWRYLAGQLSGDQLIEIKNDQYSN